MYLYIHFNRQAGRNTGSWQYLQIAVCNSGGKCVWFLLFFSRHCLSLPRGSYQGGLGLQKKLFLVKLPRNLRLEEAKGSLVEHGDIIKLCLNIKTMFKYKNWSKFYTSFTFLHSVWLSEAFMNISFAKYRTLRGKTLFIFYHTNLWLDGLKINPNYWVRSYAGLTRFWTLRWRRKQQWVKSDYSVARLAPLCTTEYWHAEEFQ